MTLFYMCYFIYSKSKLAMKGVASHKALSSAGNDELI